MSKKPEIYNVLSPYQYDSGGQSKVGWTEVGVAFPRRNGDGLVLELRPNISVAGRLVVLPRERGGQDGPDAASGVPGSFKPVEGSVDELM